MFTLRTDEEEKIYTDWKRNNDPNYCPFCNRDLVRQEFKFWIILENRFPYSKIAGKHYLLSIKRHIKDLSEITKEEYVEFESILYQINTKQIDFDMVIYNVKSKQSVPFHFHLHLIKLRK